MEGRTGERVCGRDLSGGTGDARCDYDWSNRRHFVSSNRGSLRGPPGYRGKGLVVGTAEYRESR